MHTLTADDYEMSLDGVALLPENPEPYDVDPAEDRPRSARGCRAKRCSTSLTSGVSRECAYSRAR
jgi:hypothetical protein